MVFSNLDASTNRNLIEMVATYLMSRQNANGSWDYSNRTSGRYLDLAVCGAGALGSRERGVDVSPVGLGPRGPVVHVNPELRRELELPPRRVQLPRDLSMTAAGVGSLLICQRQLDRYRDRTSARPARC